MAQFITLPQYRNPWVQNLPNMLQNMALQGVAQKFKRQQLEEDRKIRVAERKQDREREVEKGTAQLQQAGFVESEAHRPDVEYGGKGFMAPKQIVDYRNVNGAIVPVYSQQRYGKEPEFSKTGPPIKANKPSALVGQYNFAMNQYLTGQGKNPGSFTEWKKSVSRAGATRISIGEKIAVKEATSNLNIRQAVKKTEFEDKVATSLKNQNPDVWDFKPVWERQELVFREMDRRIRVAYKDENVVFDEDRKVPGWYVGNKLIRRWIDPNKHRSDKRH